MADEKRTGEILILSALTLEQDAVLQRLVGKTDISIAGYPAHCGVLEGTTVTVACLHGMGNINAAAKTAAILASLPGCQVLLVGIAGGTNKPTTEWFSDKAHLLGDVLVAEQIVDYESGKQKAEGLERRFRAFPASAKLIAAAKGISSAEWIHEVRETRPDGFGNRIIPRAHFGTVGPGEKVIADAEFVDPLKAVWTQLIGVEMEALGVAIACHQCETSAGFMMIKAICDWADPKKNDGWQKYAADTAASFAAAVVKRMASVVAVQGVASDAVVPPLIVSAKLQFIQRLHDSWKDLSDTLQIPVHERNRFLHGDEARGIWEWLESRGRLTELPDALGRIGRADLAQGLLTNP